MQVCDDALTRRIVLDRISALVNQSTTEPVIGAEDPLTVSA
jgi:hypothetical protein